RRRGPGPADHRPAGIQQLDLHARRRSRSRLPGAGAGARAGPDVGRRARAGAPPDADDARRRDGRAARHGRCGAGCLAGDSSRAEGLMYQSFYGLSELPFELTPNPKYLFLPPRHREALSALEYGLSSAKAITVLAGEAGTGKTTLLQAAIQSERCRGVDKVHLNNPALTRAEFVELLAHRF